MIIEPEHILSGQEWAFDHVEELLGRREQRIDVVSVTCDRLFAHIANPAVTPSKEKVQNFQRFVNIETLTEDLRHNLCMRVARTQHRDISDWGRMQKWILGDMELLRRVQEMC